MKKLTALLLLIAPLCSGQIRLSDRAEISVLTLGPSQAELFTAFGHSAFRIKDPLNGFDAVFNYGVFDFDRPDFYLNFARGNNLYMLGVNDYRRFEYAYVYENRYIHEQVLNLTPERKQRLFDYLQWNALPENKEYLYDYFYDNCATRIPDVVLRVFGDTVVFDGSYIKDKRTIRELTDLYLKNQPWGDLGIDICLGLPMDKEATPYEYMFLPDFVESGFAHATILVNGQREPLVKQTNITYESQPEDNDSNLLFHPFVVFTFFLLITISVTYVDFRRKRSSLCFDAALFTVLGLVGVLLLLLWSATNHKAAAGNFNLLWAMPTHLIAAVAIRRQQKWLEKYFLAVLIITGLLLLFFPVMPQKLHLSLIPLLLAVGVRAYAQYELRRRAA